MNKTQTQKIILILGVTFFVISPFSFFYGPKWLMSIFCDQGYRELSMYQGQLSCFSDGIIVGMACLVFFLILGTAFILWSMKLEKIK